jgi:hypothetical protein
MYFAAAKEALEIIMPEREIEGIGKRNLIKDPVYKRVDQIGRVLVGKELAGREVLVLVLEPVNPDDKAKFVQV